jgi:hypothetical protein
MWMWSIAVLKKVLGKAMYSWFFQLIKICPLEKPNEVWQCLENGLHSLQSPVSILIPYSGVYVIRSSATSLHSHTDNFPPNHNLASRDDVAG